VVTEQVVLYIHIFVVVPVKQLESLKAVAVALEEL
jgi:hypothetical protein